MVCYSPNKEAIQFQFVLFSCFQLPPLLIAFFPPFPLDINNSWQWNRFDDQPQIWRLVLTSGAFPQLTGELFIPQSCVSGSAQGNEAAVCHEKDQQTEPDFEESNTTGFCGERHPYFCWEPVRGVHVLLLWDTAAPVHGHGICWRSAAKFASA